MGEILPETEGSIDQKDDLKISHRLVKARQNSSLQKRVVFISKQQP